MTNNDQHKSLNNSKDRNRHYQIKRASGSLRTERLRVMGRTRQMTNSGDRRRRIPKQGKAQPRRHGKPKPIAEIP